MSAVMMPGGPVADAVYEDVAARVSKLKAEGGRVGLATLLVGDDGPSAGYIRMKQVRAAELGIESPHVHLPAEATQAEVDEVIRGFNADPGVSGMLFQHPAPGHIDYDAALALIHPDKDADGLQPYNMGRLAMSMPGPVPCTPGGIEAILAHYDVPVSGRHVVIMGRGMTLGRPLALLLSQKRPTANAAVTVLHSGVQDWAEITRSADILISAAGVPGLIQPEHVKPGGVVIGAGVRYRGKTLLPDVDVSVEEVAGWITPRVGGVGPTTVAMLMRNTIEAAERAHRATAA
jgi:methylenetetrahydrofolate dehydrogenase (NADP+)/methenyltetrahydrofolate cyclohydrolase